MKENTKQKHRKASPLKWLLSAMVTIVLMPAAIAQTVTLAPTAYGKVTSAGVQTADSLTKITSSGTRGWFKFDLSSVPSGAVITSANLIYSTTTGTTSSGNTANQLNMATDDLSLLTGTTLYGRCTAPSGATTNLFQGSWAGTAPNITLQTNGPVGGSAATATSLVTYLTGQQAVNYCCFALKRGSTNVYNFAVPSLVINYTIPSPCTGTPAPGNTLSSSATICAGTNYTLSLQNPTSGSGVKYQWMSSSDSLTFSPILNDTLSILTINPSSITTTYYQCVVTCSGNSGTSTAIKITVNPSPTVTVNSPSTCRAGGGPGTTATLIANGATTYAWSAGVTVVGHDTATVAPTATTSYTVTGTTAGCSSTAVATVTVNRTPTVTVNSPTICPGQTATLIAPLGTGTTGTPTYSWSAGATIVAGDTATASPTVTSTYTVTVTIAGCSGTALSTVTVNPLPITVNSPTICSAGTATLIASGGTTYTWSAGATSPNNNDTAYAAPAATATYTVTGSNGTCSNTAVATVTVVTALSITVNSPSICSGQTATLTASGGVTYTWSAGATSTGVATATASPTATTTYTVTGISGSCSNTAIATVSINPFYQCYCTTGLGGGCTASAIDSIAITGTTLNNGPTGCSTNNYIAYPATGSTTATLTQGNTYTLNDMFTGNVRAGVWIDYNHNGTFDPSEYTSICTTSGTLTNVAIPVTIPMSAMTGQTGMRVRSRATAGTMDSTSACATFGSGETEDYIINITAALPCTSPPTAGTTVASVTTGCVGNIVSLSLNGNGTGIGMTYQWQSSVDGGATWTPISGATSSTHSDTLHSTISYQCVLTCSGLSSASTMITVTVNAAPTVTVNSPTLCRAGGGPGGSVTLIANGATTYTWSAGATPVGHDTATAAPFTTTNYTVTGTAGGCTATAVATVTVSNSPTVTVNSPTICTGQTATLIANSTTTGLTYTWSAGAVFVATDTATAAPSATTTYTVTGTATTGCSGTAVATVHDNSPNVTVNSPTICIGATATLVASGAASYTWAGGATSPNNNDTAYAAPASTATYTVSGTANACTTTVAVTVTVVTSLSVVVNSPTICTGQTASLVASGANTYTWSTGATSIGIDSATANPTTLTSYTVTGSSGGCAPSTAVATVTVNPLPTITVNSPAICRGSTAILLANGGTSYTWSAGATFVGNDTATAAPNNTTTYTVTGTSSSGCSNTAVATVTVNRIPAVTVNSPTICSGQTATMLSNSNIAGTTYTWSTGATFVGNDTATANPTTTNTYTVTGTAAGCSGTAVSTVHVNPTPTITVNSPTICAAQTATLVANGATTYTWSAGITPIAGTDSATAAPVGNITFTVTGTTGTCKDSAIATISVVTSLTVTVNSPAICGGQTAVLVANGANTYTWSAGATSSGINTATANPTSTASYTVTGSSGTCVSTAVSTVSVYPVNLSTSTAGTTITANAAGVTYQWINCTTHTIIGGATSQSFTATANGNYAVILNNGNCTDTSACVNITSIGIATLSNSSVISIYPNPFTDQTTITFGEVQKNTSVRIIDMLGNEVKLVLLNGVNNLVIEKGDMHAGIYFIQITDDNHNVVNRKVIVN